ncbi:four-carbon acid sugar kinase family protein [Alicyclobacillus shizuokensis]|uniref:four-carbon acid sugar kinase family protein n=1 Tax=Alicyclobacillus shizuokensis TaxID=392014 RepID=UPI0008332E0F|nr:four-carbon acid sugar kinase family protein [Alicyclobacillus shizuokensis]
MLEGQKASARVHILADDLTGAADAANYFQVGGYRVRVGLDADRPWEPQLGVDVVQVADTETRGLPPAEARRRVYQAAAGASGGRVYKKVDSTLRGHLGLEIETALLGLGRRVAVLAPAFPANGRQVEGGRLTVAGVPVHRTAFGRDPRNPVRSDRIREVLAETTSLPVAELPLAIVRSGPDAILTWMSRLESGERIVVADATEDQDLCAVAEAFADRPDILLCGSAGLAKQLPRLWLAPMDGEARDRGLPAVGCDKVLVVVGSANPAAHEQLEVMAGKTGAPVIELNPSLLADDLARQWEMERAQRALAQTCHSVVALRLGLKRLDRGDRRLEADLAAAARVWSERWAGGTVGFVATGGDTALALCKALGARALWPGGEVTTGIPWNTVETESGRTWMVTKAGGFGDPDALLRAVRFLRNMNNEKWR